VAHNEPPFPPAKGFGFIKQLFLYLLWAAFSWPLCAALTPPFFFFIFIYGYPPHIPYVEESLRTLKLCLLAENPDNPHLPFYIRLWIFAQVLNKIIWIPLGGMSYFLDEFLYGKQMRDVKIIHPLFEISSARSGSTQMARYLEQDESLTGPNVFQIMFPYLWAWKLSNATLGRMFSKEQIEEKMLGILPEAVKQKHEMSFFGIETYEITFLMSHLRAFSMGLGPYAHQSEWCFGSIPSMDYNWNINFPKYVDHMARKHMIFHNNENGKKRLFIKGHFLGGATALHKKYPDADFFTVLRPPHLVCQSMINFTQSFEMDPVIGRIPWKYNIIYVTLDQIRYCKEEKEWYEKEDGANKLILRFSDYVNDLEGTMKVIYQHCMNGKPVPDNIPKEHPPRDRKNYLMNRSLEEMGISEKGLREELEDYYEWMEHK